MLQSIVLIHQISKLAKFVVWDIHKNLLINNEERHNIPNMA